MIISRAQVANLLNDIAKNEKRSNVTNKEDKKIGENDLKVIETGKAFEMARKVINDAPEIREDRLANVAQALSTGTYTVSDEEIAEKMIARSLVDKLV